MGIGRADYLELGTWNATCYECGRKRKANTLVRNWQGYYVCRQHNESRQPQDFVRNIPDVIKPPWAQPVSDTFRAICSIEGRQGVAGVGLAGCATTGLDLSLR